MDALARANRCLLVLAALTFALGGALTLADDEPSLPEDPGFSGETLGGGFVAPESVEQGGYITITAYAYSNNDIDPVSMVLYLGQDAVWWSEEPQPDISTTVVCGPIYGPVGSQVVVRIWARNEVSGEEGQASGPVTITAAPNKPPHAVASADKTEVAVGEEVHFNSDASWDPDGYIVSYEWDFGDEATSDDANPTHSYTAAGTYEVSLVVTDDDGLASGPAHLTITVTAANLPPVAEASADKVLALVGEEIHFNAASSYDPDGEIASYSWDFGDGGASTASAPAHTFTEPGEYAVSLVVTDDDGAASAPASVTILVTSKPLRIGKVLWVSPPPGSLRPEESFIYVGGSVKFECEVTVKEKEKELEWPYAEKPLKCTWRVNDQPLPTVTVRERPTYTRQFNEPGIFMVSLTVEDEGAPKEPQGPAKVTVMSVEFQDAAGNALGSPHRVGITVGNNNRTQHLRAVVRPTGEAAKIALQTTSPNLSMTNVKRAEGGFTFDLVGAYRSDAKGDMSILAIHQSELAWMHPVSVVIPGAIGTPHPQVDQVHGAVVGRNMVLSRETSPFWTELLPGDVKLVTAYLHWLDVPVADQFGDGIGSLYAGATVEEEIRGDWFDINQTLRIDGTYNDPVGAIQEVTEVFFGGDKFTDANGNGQWDAGEVVTVDYGDNGVYDPPDTQVTAWPTAPTRPLAPGPDIQNIPVKVDGYTLAPSVVNRTVTAIPGVPPAADVVTIVWP